jgi:hypothetical protein
MSSSGRWTRPSFRLHNGCGEETDHPAPWRSAVPFVNAGIEEVIGFFDNFSAKRKFRLTSVQRGRLKTLSESGARGSVFARLLDRLMPAAIGRLDLGMRQWPAGFGRYAIRWDYRWFWDFRRFRCWNRGHA